MIRKYPTPIVRPKLLR